MELPDLANSRSLKREKIHKLREAERNRQEDLDRLDSGLQVRK